MRTFERTGLAVIAALVVIASSAAAAQTPAPKPPTKPAQGTTAKPAPQPAPKARPGAGTANPAAKPAGDVQPTPGAGPVIVVETSKGVFEFETYPDDAPKTVDNILALTKKGFYNGQRFHRVVPGFVIQAGDPQTRDMTKRDQWGRGMGAGSGKPVGVAEFSKK